MLGISQTILKQAALRYQPATRLGRELFSQNQGKADKMVDDLWIQTSKAIKNLNWQMNYRLAASRIVDVLILLAEHRMFQHLVHDHPEISVPIVETPEEAVWVASSEMNNLISQGDKDLLLMVIKRFQERINEYDQVQAISSDQTNQTNQTSSPSSDLTFDQKWREARRLVVKERLRQTPMFKNRQSQK